MSDSSPRRASGAAIILLFLLFAAATVAAALTLRWRLDVASEHGPGVDRMIDFLLVATGVMFVAGHVIAVGLILKGRREGEPFRPPSKRAELWTTLIPICVVALVAEGGVIVIGMPVWGQIYEPDPKALQVEMVGKQFEWIARYPGKDGKFGRIDPGQTDESLNPIGLDENDPDAADDIVVRGALYLPAGRTASIRIRSQDVLHSFAVPVFRTKQDTVPGMPTRTQVKPVKVGKFEIDCAELCGLGHYKMRASVNVLEGPAFEKWLSEQTGWFE